MGQPGRTDREYRKEDEERSVALAETIVVVSGIPRTGTSLMMKMLGRARWHGIDVIIVDGLTCPKN